jgi:hypothetical protein
MPLLPVEDGSQYADYKRHGKQKPHNDGFSLEMHVASPKPFMDGT